MNEGVEGLMMQRGKQVIFAALALGIAAVPSAFAGMEPMSEEEMGQVTGQASMLGLDVSTNEQAEFTRYTIGMETELQMNMEELALGDDGSSADVGINHLSLGHIAREDGVQFDGQTYSANDIVPFVGFDPFFEMAQQDGDVIGFRIGFTQARGTLSGDIQSLTGRLGMELEDDEGNVHDGQLLQADGTPDNQRATHFGLAGEDFTTDCDAGENCVPLNMLQTLEVGERDEDGNADFTDSFFISFQQQDLDWVAPDGQSVSTDSGVFFNIPTAMRQEMQQLQSEGLPRARTEFIDRGEGLF